MVAFEKPYCRNAQPWADLSIVDSMRLRAGQQGLTLLELTISLAIIMILAALAVPNINQTIATQRLRTSAGDLSGLVQQTRTLAARNNATYAILFGTKNGSPIAWADLNGNGTFDDGVEPVVYYSNKVFPAAGAPPTPYVLTGDSGGAFAAGTTLGFSPRGLPCAYNGATLPPTCTTPAAQYFTFYITDNRPTPGWAVTIVTKGARSKVSVWNGTTWGN